MLIDFIVHAFNIDRFNRDEIGADPQRCYTCAEEEQRRRDLIEARNTADNAVYSAEKTLRDLGDKVPEDVKANVEAAIERVQSVHDHEDPAEINREVEALMQALQTVGQAAYSQPQEQQPEQNPSGDQTPPDGDVVDGDFQQD